MAVSYTRINWVNRIVQRVHTYTESTNTDGSITHNPAPGTIIQAGTPRSADNMNHMDKGIKDCADAINDLEETVNAQAQTLNSHGTRIQTNETAITGLRQKNTEQDETTAALRQDHNALATAEGQLATRTDAHIANKNNPHEVTASQVGLGNVPNVGTNDQTPTYTRAATLANLSSGEKMSTAFGKIAKAVYDLIAHIANKNNPHEVTKSQVGLGNVPNVTTNNQTPTYNRAANLADLSSGETISAAFGKISKAVNALIAHLANRENPHEVDLFQVAERVFESAWGRPDVIGTYIGNGSSAATLDVNGSNVRGQQIDLGFAPAKVIIFIPIGEINLGHDEAAMEKNNVLDAIMGGLYGYAAIGPLKNYYHSGCGNTMENAAPQSVLSRNHGGAVVYQNSFIVQSYNNADTESNSSYPKANIKGQSYRYMAWRQ